MENASKALIIAGAILISILLISVGIIIMNAINNPVQQSVSSADSQAVQVFNADFLNYEGSQLGTTIKSLLATVNAHNNTDTTNRIQINNIAIPAQGYNITNFTNVAAIRGNNFNNNRRLNVILQYGGEGGRINNINIVQP